MQDKVLGSLCDALGPLLAADKARRAALVGICSHEAVVHDG